MRRIIIVFSVVLSLISCSTSDRDFNGEWKSTYISPKFDKESDVYFKDFELFEKSNYEPTICIFGDTIRYDLGFGSKDLSFQSNYAKVNFEYNKLKIQSHKQKESFDLEFVSVDAFCLLKNNNKLACFTKNESKANEICKMYSIDLTIREELYDIYLNLSPSEGQIIRAGHISDTTSFKINGSDEKYIRMLVSSINGENFIPQKEITSGDYSEYEIKLKCDDKFYESKLNGSRGISFELRALLKNLEDYIGTKFR